MAAKPQRKDTVDLDAMNFEWDDSVTTGAVAATNYRGAELDGPLAAKATARVDVDMGGYDKVLDSMMNGLSGLDIASESSLFRACERCSQNVASVDAVDLGGRWFHERCAPQCASCRKPVNPAVARDGNRDEIVAIKQKIVKSEKVLSALKTMRGMYAAGSREATDVGSQIADAEQDIIRFTKKISKLEATGAGYAFAAGAFYHPACFTCTMVGCGIEIPSDEFINPDTGRAVCRRHFYERTGMICAKCNEPIDVLQNVASIAVESKRFHSHCFTCHHCTKPMRQFKLCPDQQVYCLPCSKALF